MSSDLTFYTDGKRHLVCFPFSKENLFRMADKLGIKYCWFHNSSGGIHFDIPKRRIAEIEAKCVIVKSKTIIEIIDGKFMPCVV